MKRKLIMINLKANRPIINILGEVCWGFHLKNFENEIGAPEKFVEQLLKQLLEHEKNQHYEIFLDLKEVEIIRKSLTVVEREIQDWEFETRIGYTLCEVKKLPVFSHAFIGKREQKFTSRELETVSYFLKTKSGLGKKVPIFQS